VREHFQAGIGARGLELHRAWWAQFEEYRRQYPELADQGYRMLRRELPDRWDEGFPSFSTDGKGLATRDASGQALILKAQGIKARVVSMPSWEIFEHYGEDFLDCGASRHH
jgi:transketolase